MLFFIWNVFLRNIDNPGQETNSPCILAVTRAIPLCRPTLCKYPLACPNEPKRAYIGVNVHSPHDKTALLHWAARKRVSTQPMGNSSKKIGNTNLLPGTRENRPRAKWQRKGGRAIARSCEERARGCHSESGGFWWDPPDFTWRPREGTVDIYAIFCC